MNLPTYLIKENSFLARIAAKKLRKNNVAMVLGKTIHLWNTTTAEFLQNEKWVKHEMCHVKQFQHYGFAGFIIKYLWESAKKGYYHNKYEVQAREAENL
ncbi:MAG: DUF4157 domain-containing protein [Ferruginibacter sp.]|nr:DUF4157 domain-containing protein [Ferruginibacter sp.]